MITRFQASLSNSGETLSQKNEKDWGCSTTEFNAQD